MSKGIKEFKGVIPAVLSVFNDGESLDENGTREFIRYLLHFSIGGLYVTGSTGECFLMSSEERMRQVEIIMEEAGDKLPIVVHVGAMSTRDAITLAKHAERNGATGVSSVPPFYFKYTEDQIYNYYKDIAESTALPMIIYNIPLAGMMSVSMIKRLSEIKNVEGVKYTGTAIYEVTQIKETCKAGFQVYGGCDELASSNIALGVDGIIGSFYNCIPDLFIRIWNSIKNNDMETASILQKKALRVISTGVNNGSMMACLKLWLRAAGVPVGYARRPFTNFTDEERIFLVNALLQINEEEDLQLEIVKHIKMNQ